MGHAQFAEHIGARGPNTHINTACASSTQGLSLAEDWIRAGRCRRVVVLAADDVTGDDLFEWIGSGLLATGAAATDGSAIAALPFDRRRHGLVLGMGCSAVVVESEDALVERGMRGIVEVLCTETRNSAFHGTKLDPEHIASVMDNLVSTAERRFGLNRYAMAAQTLFVSHETYTPARGGSAAGEIDALRHTFGDAASQILNSNTKGLTGHPMGVGIEDVVGVKALEHGRVPAMPNCDQPDPDFGPLNLSRGGRYPVRYALRLAAGFGSQLALTLTRRIPGSADRVDDPIAQARWLVRRERPRPAPDRGRHPDPARRGHRQPRSCPCTEPLALRPGPRPQDSHARGARSRVNERCSGCHCCPGATALRTHDSHSSRATPCTLRPGASRPRRAPGLRHRGPVPRIHPVQPSRRALPGHRRREDRLSPQTCSTSSWISRPTSVSTP